MKILILILALISIVLWTISSYSNRSIKKSIKKRIIDPIDARPIRHRNYIISAIAFGCFILMGVLGKFL